MATIRTLSTDDLMIYDDDSQELFIVDPDYTDECLGGSVNDAIDEARGLVKSGHAQHFDRTAMNRLEQALASVNALG